MPSSLLLNGLRVFRPAIYAEVDASSLGGQAPSTGNVCLVGAFPTFKQNEALTFTSASGLVAYDSTDAELALLGKIAFSPSLDDRVPAGAASLSFLNVQSTAQASTTLLDADGNDALVLKSRVYSPKGNRTTVQAEHESPDQIKLTINRDSITEVFEQIESGDLASLYYAGSLLSVVTLTATRSAVSLAWQQTSAPINNGALNVDVSDIATSSTLSITLSETDHTNSVFVALSGTSTTGAAVTETLSYLAGDGAAQTTANSYSAIESITVITDDNTYTGALEISGSITFDPSEYSDLNELIVALNALSGFTAAYTAARSYPATEIDAVSGGIVGIANTAIFRADLHAIVLALASSQLVTAERATTGTKPPAQSGVAGSVTQRLSGGAQGTVALSDWTGALETIEASDFQIIVGWSTDIDTQKEIKKHLPKSARAGKERNAWLAVPSNTSLATIKSNYTIELNDRNIALVGQSIDVTKPNGKREVLEPRYLALMLAAMQAGTPTGTPLTRKRPDVNDVSGNWNPNRDAEDAIKAGVVSLSYSTLGYRVERSVTTYQTDDNPIFSEVSANESVNTSIRSLRVSLDTFIGQANQSLTANRIKSLVQAHLNRQVQDNIIKAYKDVNLEDAGDALIVKYTVAAIEPINFIKLAVSVQRF